MSKPCESSSDEDERMLNNAKLFDAIRKRPSEQEVLAEVEKCLNDKAEVNAQNQRGKTILHIAVEKDYKKIVEFLLNKKKVTGNIRNNDGQTALDLAKNLCNGDIIKIFENYNNEPVGAGASKLAANINNQPKVEDLNTNDQMICLANSLGLQSTLPYEIVTLTKDQLETLNKLDEEGNIKELKQATITENIQVINFLIGCGVDINHQSTKTKLRIIDLAWEEGHYGSMLALLKLNSKFPQNFSLDGLDQDGKKSVSLKNWISEVEQLHKWIIKNELEKVKNFVSQHKPTKCLNCKNQSALETAAAYANVEMLKVLSDLQPSLLKQENEEADTLLFIAAKSGKKDNVDFFVKCGFDVNHCNKELKRAVDFAWDNKYYDVVLKLLEADSEFPIGFNLDSLNEESPQKELRQFVEERNCLHNTLIKEGNLESIKDYISGNRSTFYLNSQGKSAALTATENEKFNIYAFLQSIGVGFKNDSEKECINYLPEGKKDTLQETMLSYFPAWENAHVFYLISKSKPKKHMDKFEEKVQALYKKLNCIEEISMILKVVQFIDYLDIIFDFDNENIKYINPTASDATKGTTDYKNGRIYIAADIEENKLLGTLAHELTHLAMYIIYKNDCNPFHKSDSSKMQDFTNISAKIKEEITGTIKEIEMNSSIEDSPIVTLARAFRYPEDEQQSELIVRIPHILAQYEEEKVRHLFENEPLKLLWDYYKDQVEGGMTFNCETFIKNSCLIKPKSKIKFLNETVGEIKNIIQYEITFKIPIDLNKFLMSNQQVLILRTESTLLSTLSIYQSLIKKAHSIMDCLFFNFNLYLEKQNEINKAFYSGVCKVLCIIYTYDSDKEKLSAVLNILNTLLGQKKDKKIIFIIQDSKVQEWDEDIIFSNKIYDCEDKCHKFTLNDITDESQKKILEKEVTFLENKIQLNTLINEDLEKKDLLDTETLVKLIKNEEIKIGNKPLGISDLESSYSKCYEEIDEVVLREQLSQESDDIIVLSSITQDQIIAKLNIRNHNQIGTQVERVHQNNIIIGNGKRVIIYEECRENNFKKLCHANPKKEITWISWSSNKFILQQLYNPNFLIKREFKKTVISNDIKHKFKKDPVFSFLNSKQFTTLEQVDQDKLLSLFKEYLATIKNILIIDEPKERISAIYSDADIKYSPELENKLKNFVEETTVSEYNPQKQFQELTKYCFKSVHWLKIEGSSSIKHLIWHQSYGSLNVLRQYIDNDQVIAITGNEFFGKIKDDKAAIIIDVPGMGKSTTLTTLSEELLESYWVIRIQLKDHSNTIDQLPNQLDINSVLVFLENAGSIVTPLARNLVEYKLKYISNLKPLLLACDGFDELKDQRKNKFSKLLKFLKDSTEAFILVTAREHEANILQDSLSIFDIKFIKLAEPQQKKILEIYWKNNLKWSSSIHYLHKVFSDAPGTKFSIYTEELLNMMNKVLIQKNSSFMGIPLILRLLAEIFQGKFQKFISNIGDNSHAEDFNNLDILTVYQDIGVAKYRIYLKEKIGFTTDLICESSFTIELTKKYWRLAFQELFPEQAKDFIGMKAPFSEFTVNNATIYDDKELEALIRVGLIKSTHFTNFEFIHRTFAECFVAELLNYWLSKAHGRHQKYPATEKFLLTIILLNQEYKMIRFFLNVLLNKKHLTIDALKLYKQKTLKLWSEAQKQFFSKSHQTALHISTQENNEQIIHLLLNIFSSGQEKHMSFLTVRDAHQETALYVAAKNKSDNLIKMFLDSVKDCKKNIQQELLLATIFRKSEDEYDPNVLYLLEYISTKEYVVMKEILSYIKDKWYLIRLFLPVVKKPNIKNCIKHFEEQFKIIGDSNIKKYLMLSSDENSNTVLHITCELGHYYKTKWLIEQGADILALNKHGDSLLHSASYFGYLPIVKFLISRQANVRASNYNGNSVLHAATNSNAELVKWLVVDCGVNVNTTDKFGYTALYHAVAWDHLEIAQFLIPQTDIDKHSRAIIDKLIDKDQWDMVQLMIEKGVEVNSKYNNETIMLKVARRLAKNYKGQNIKAEVIDELDQNIGQYKVLQSLLDHGADINAKSYDGFTAFDLAVARGHWEVAKWFVSHGANITSHVLYAASYAEWVDLNFLESLIKDKKEVGKDIVKDFIDTNGNTVLHKVPRRCSLLLLDLLLRYGALINVENNDGYTALDLAVARGNWEIANWFVSHGANITSQVLIAAEFAGSIDSRFLESLIKDRKKAGKDIVNSVIDSNKNTVLHNAAQRGNLTLVIFLLGQDALINVENNDGYTALDFAVAFARWYIVRLLMNRGASVSSQVLYAASYATLIDFTILESWIEDKKKAGEDIVNGFIDSNGNTVLHNAAQRGNLKLVKFLLKYSHVNTPNHNGYTALDLAVANGYWKIAKLFVSHSANVTSQIFIAAMKARSIDFEFLESLIKDKKEAGEDIVNGFIDSNGNTVLHNAAQIGNLELFNLLKNHVSDVNVPNYDGYTALELVQSSAKHEMDKNYEYFGLWTLPLLKGICLPKDPLSYETWQEKNVWDTSIFNSAVKNEFVCFSRCYKRKRMEI